MSDGAAIVLVGIIGCCIGFTAGALWGLTIIRGLQDDLRRLTPTQRPREPVRVITGKLRPVSCHDPLCGHCFPLPPADSTVRLYDWERGR